ncbi:DUF397 domain-containing protein [Streptomyces sp. NPDC002734]|uniref:DUF397 domain-containing protein n=1 Tax=Streptomyces sp. NPDC002734 TaxID=3154426 RepID=UPI00332CB1C2
MTDETAAQLTWCKSSYSGNEGGECLEVAISSAAVHVRDSKDTARAGLSLTPAAWKAFLALTTP